MFTIWCSQQPPCFHLLGLVDFVKIHVPLQLKALEDGKTYSTILCYIRGCDNVTVHESYNTTIY
ncbi:MAG: hypothetical protein ABI337_06145, partial [Nitrososphaera sp.]